ncbi:hypothetical protein [Saccharicrinis sp. FJH54]|uniref:hypothetical protein n=1 Tax=Saccharicrinis sp. FJH54 TaxID=3344665 RepID=UPI0035D4E6A1
MKTQFALFKIILISGCFVFLFACEKDDVKKNTTNLTNVYENTTLDSSKVYIVDEAVQVEATLIISPGTVIKFTSGKRIDINAGGSVQAIGTSEAPIIFTSIKDDSYKGDTNEDGKISSPAVKDWGCVIAAGDLSTFTHCKFLYGGGFGDHTATLEAKGEVIITDCVFAHNYGGELDDNTNGALYLIATALSSVVTNNTFFDNRIPVTIDVNYSFGSSNIFHDPDMPTLTNTFNGIFVSGYTMNHNVNWSENEVPYVATGHIGIDDGYSLTLQSDVVIKMYQDTRIDIIANGVLNHNGAIITSFRDDSALGDTNGDGASTTATTGDWVGVNLGYGDYMHGDNIRYALH